MFAEMIHLAHNKERLSPEELNHIGQMMDSIRQHCDKKQITIPKAIIEPRNEQALNNYIRNEGKRSEGKIELNRSKMKMYLMAHQILSESPLDEEEGNIGI